MDSLDDEITKLPPRLQQEVHNFVDFLLQKSAKQGFSKLTLVWTGGLREYHNQYTSLGLQKKRLSG